MDSRLSKPATSYGCPAARKKRSKLCRRPHPNPEPITDSLNVLTSQCSPTDYAGQSNIISNNSEVHTRSMDHERHSLTSTNHVRCDFNRQDSFGEPLRESNHLGNENKLKKAKLKIDGITQTLQTRHTSEIALGSVPVSVRSSKAVDVRVAPQKQMSFSHRRGRSRGSLSAQEPTSMLDDDHGMPIRGSLLAQRPTPMLDGDHDMPSRGSLSAQGPTPMSDDDHDMPCGGSLSAQEPTPMLDDDHDMPDSSLPSQILDTQIILPTPTEATGSRSLRDNELHPSGLWFHCNRVVRDITKCIQRHFDGPYTSWSTTPPHVKEQWWRDFRGRYQWHPDLEQSVRGEFEKKGAARLKDMIHKAGKADYDNRVRWMSKEVREELKKVRATPEFRKKSIQFSKNKLTERGRKHRQGSVSARELAERTMSSGDRIPSRGKRFEHHTTPDSLPHLEVQTLQIDDHDDDISQMSCRVHTSGGDGRLEHHTSLDSLSHVEDQTADDHDDGITQAPSPLPSPPHRLDLEMSSGDGTPGRDGNFDHHTSSDSLSHLDDQTAHDQDDGITQAPLSLPPPPERLGLETGSSSGATLDQASGATPSGARELRPDGLWFHKPSVVHDISSSIQSHFDGPYMNWTSTPSHVRERWFRTFKEQYTWQPSLDAEVKAQFNKKGQVRLKDMIYKAGKAKDSDPILWMPDSVRVQINEIRSRPEFKKKSERFSKNKLEGSLGGHCQGSVSTQELAERIAKQKGGERPKPSDMFAATHQRKDKSFCDERSKQVWDTYQGLKEKYEREGAKKTDDEIFFEASGGFKKGTVYGLGSGVNLYFEKPTSRSSQSTGSSVYTPSFVSQLESRIQLQSEELKQTKEALEQQRQEHERERQETREAMALMEQEMQAISRFIRDRCKKGDVLIEPAA